MKTTSKSNETTAPRQPAPSPEDVQGRGVTMTYACPLCGSCQHPVVDYAGETFICNNCGGHFQIWI